jgi:hypothetical protein
MPVRRANTPVNGKEQDKDRPCLKWLCMMYADDRNAGLLLYFALGWQKHAKLHRKGKAGLWIAVSRADILAGTGMSLKQYNRGRKRLQTLEGVYLEGGGFRGKRSLFMQCTDRLERFLRRGYATKSAARKALEAFRQEAQQEAVDPTATTQVGPTGPTNGHYPGNNEGHNKGHNPIQSTLSTLSIHPAHEEESGVLEEKEGKEKEKPGMNGEGDEIDHTGQIVPEKSQTPAPPGAKPAPPSPKLPKPPGAELPSVEPSAELLELLWEAFKQHKIEEWQKENPNLEIDQDDQDFLEQSKQLTLSKLKKDLKLYPELPIPKGCPLVHPARKEPARWLGLSAKYKAAIYFTFKPYLENWKNGKAGKHATSVYGFGSKFKLGGSGTKTMKHVLPEEDQALIDAEFAGWDLDQDEDEDGVA